ncbi:hypothetical protein [Haliea sp. E17]|uniref:hypothetical protein n=1 Tax=Haliea sp. E17 TaxID=3401576 RepID=UPI003AAFB838
MHVTQVKSLRWLFAELLVIVLGISIAFQVEQWRQQHEDKAMETRAFREVLGDLDNIEKAIAEAAGSLDAATESASDLVQLIAAENTDENKYLESILGIHVYLIGEAQDRTAYEGLLEAGRFAGVDNPELTVHLRNFFTLQKPWVYSLNIRHIERYDNLMNTIYRDLQRVPDADFSTTRKSHIAFAVPLNEFPRSPTMTNDLLGFIASSQTMKERFAFLQQQLEDVRGEIDLYLGK